MEEKKTRALNIKLSADDHDKLMQMIAKLRQETNLKVTQAEMVAKLIRDAYDKQA